ncbi:hypothetical protein BJ875DRAFT_447164, partial [Amylocarpus encephaloides]
LHVKEQPSNHSKTDDESLRSTSVPLKARIQEFNWHATNPNECGPFVAPPATENLSDSDSNSVDPKNKKRHTPAVPIEILGTHMLKPSRYMIAMDKHDRTFDTLVLRPGWTESTLNRMNHWESVLMYLTGRSYEDDDGNPAECRHYEKILGPFTKCVTFGQSVYHAFNESIAAGLESLRKMNNTRFMEWKSSSQFARRCLGASFP